MKINNNSWNKFRYTLYSPVYDKIVKVFKRSRKRSIDSLNIKSDEKVLIIGAGTGSDLEFLPKGCFITATDITPAMIEKLKKKNDLYNHQLEAMVMDGQKLDFKNNVFDKVILHLILAVIPDPVACLREAERVLKPGGEIAVFDKFIQNKSRVTSMRKMLNVITNFFFSDITRNIDTIVTQTSLKKITDEPANFGGNFRLVRLKKYL